MPAKADEPLQKITLNLYEADVLALETYYGRGWSEQVRSLVRDHTFKLTAYANVKQTLGDLG